VIQAKVVQPRCRPCWENKPRGGGGGDDPNRRVAARWGGAWICLCGRGATEQARKSREGVVAPVNRGANLARAGRRGDQKEEASIKPPFAKPKIPGKKRQLRSAIPSRLQREKRAAQQSRRKRESERGPTDPNSNQQRKSIVTARGGCNPHRCLSNQSEKTGRQKHKEGGPNTHLFKKETSGHLAIAVPGQRAGRVVGKENKKNPARLNRQPDY